MNGHAHRPSADDYGMAPQPGTDPSGRVVVESYQNDIVNGFEKPAPFHNPVRPRALAPLHPSPDSNNLTFSR